MSFNTQGTVQVPLSVFGGLATEVDPDSLPEGASPDNQDMTFVPGGASSRPGLQKVFATAFPNSPSVVYGKSYVTPTGQILNLYFDSNGILWKEDFTNSPGTYTQLFQSTRATFCKSITAFGREYIAISDGLHGQEVPLQYDGKNLDRVTQDGPGSPPTVTSVALPSVNMAVTAAPSVLTVTEVDPAALVGSNYTQVNIYVTSLGGASAGQTITIAGNSTSALNGTYAILNVYGGASSLIVASAFLANSVTYGTGGTGTLGSGSTAVRSGNTVTVGTASAHQLKPGYQVQMGGLSAAVVGGVISSIVINNESAPGLATVTMSNPTGLSPNTFVTMTGISGSVVGGSISSIGREGDVVTVATASAHGLTPGAVITISGSTSSFNTTTTVAQVTSPSVFTYVQIDSDGAGSGGSVTLNWPITNSATPNYYQVEAVPTATTFQVALNYSDGTWSNGQVSFAWDGNFFVQTVPNSTTFTYQQNGPNASTSQVGTVTPYGQAAPGIHQCCVSFLTRQGAITAPSPPVTFTANGGQYISVSNLPIGPSNVVARVIQFTGAQGADFFYIPVEAQINGQFVATATQINDNTSPSVLLDFSDNTLFRATGTSIPGNTLANQIVLEGALGFGSYASRLIAYGQRNIVDNLLNMGFDGGFLPSSPTLPTGWGLTITGGTLSAGHFGQAWTVTTKGGGTIQPSGVLVQSFYEDAYGAPIGQPNTTYRFRGWFETSTPAGDTTFEARLYSVSGSFSLSVSISTSIMTSAGSWIEMVFNGPTPAVLPSDTVFSVWFQSVATIATYKVDEMSLIYNDTPYLTDAYSSYANNPEGVDGVTGNFGPPQGSRTLMDMAIIRNSLYLLTQDPSGALFETNDNGVTEPVGWTVNQVASNCGAISAYSTTKSQADDETGSGGEEWISWASASGARIFGGDQPWQISLEISPNWNGKASRGFQGLNFSAALSVWSLNDNVERVIYFGVPSLDGGANSTAPNEILVVNYRELDSANQIAQAPTVRAGYNGKLIAADNARKWTVWRLAMNGGSRMYRGSQLSTVFFCGNGQKPGTAASFGNVYTLTSTKLTDDDYGQIYPYYMTYGFVSRDQEQGMQLGSVRKLLSYATGFARGVGNLTLNYLPDSITNIWPISSTRPLNLAPTRDMNFAGGSVNADRIFFKISSSPLPNTTDNGFSLSKFMAAMKPAGRLPVTGSL